MSISAVDTLAFQTQTVFSHQESSWSHREMEKRAVLLYPGLFITTGLLVIGKKTGLRYFWILDLDATCFYKFIFKPGELSGKITNVN